MFTAGMLAPYHIHRFAYLGALFVGWHSQGNEHGGCVSIGYQACGNEFVHVEVANPAGAKSLFSSCQTKVLGGDGNVDVGVVVSVALSRPGFRLVLQADDDDWGRLYPIAFVALVNLLQPLLVINDEEAPRLQVDGGRSQSYALLDVV